MAVPVLPYLICIIRALTPTQQPHEGPSANIAAQLLKVASAQTDNQTFAMR